MHPLDFRFRGLKTEMVAVEKASSEFQGIEQYLVRTCGSTHHMQYQLEDVFRIERQGESKRFDESPYAKIPSDRRLLWHGSRTTNYGGILSQGLRIAPPEAPVSGYMFGKGIYLADMSSKSANCELALSSTLLREKADIIVDCFSYLSGGQGLLMLCEAELGKPMQVLQDAHMEAGEMAKKMGAHSTWGQVWNGASEIKVISAR